MLDTSTPSTQGNAPFHTLPTITHPGGGAVVLGLDAVQDPAGPGPPAAGPPALQGLLNATVLECARARPAEAAAFLAQAHAVVGMCPAACEPAALVALWDAAAAAAATAARAPPR